MTAKDIITLSCDFIDLPEVRDKLKNGTELSQEEQKIVDKLVECLNLVQSEIAIDHRALLSVEKHSLFGGALYYSSLKGTPLKILYIKDINGKRLSYKLETYFIKVEPNIVTIAYLYSPKVLTLNSTITETLATERAYAYGVAREYCLLTTRLDEADIWESRFKNSLKSYMERKGSIVLKPRSFYGF